MAETALEMPDECIGHLNDAFADAQSVHEFTC